MPDHLDSLDYTLQRYDESAGQRLRFEDRDITGWDRAARGRLRELLGPMPAAPVPLRPRYGETVRRPGHTRTPVVFATRDDLDACGFLLIPDALKPGAAGVLCLPGHGRGAEEIVGIDDAGQDRDHHDGYQHDFAVQSVERGHVTLALEMLGFGRRRDPAARDRGKGTSSCQPAAGAALLLGETMAGWRTWDALRALDLLAGRPEVDPARLALIGISGGGTVGLYTAALDDRVKVAVLSGSFCTFRDSIFSVAHCIDNYVPGVLSWFEMADIAGLIAPRALFVESGDDDPIFPKPGVETALEAAARIYSARGAGDRLAHAFFPAAHRFDGAAAFPKLEEWLGSGRA